MSRPRSRSSRLDALSQAGAGVLVLLLLAGPSLAEEEREALGTHALLEEIRLRQTALDRRAAELDDREREIAALDRAVDERLAELESLASTLEARIAAWESGAGDAVRRLAKIYAAMPPPRAAALIEALDLALATQIVSKMKDKKSAAVMALVSPERALAMSRKVAHPLAMNPAALDGDHP